MGEERRKADSFTQRLAEAYGDTLVFVLLYGSAARGEYREGVSNLNLLVVLRSAEPAMLRRGSALARDWVQAGNPPPLLLSEAEWRESADVFAIEYSDMRDAHVLLHGQDPFARVDVAWSDLRLQCERELKSKQVQLREHYLLAADRPEDLGQLLVQSFPTFLTLLRTVLRLAGAAVPRDAEAVVRGAAQRVGFDPAGFLEVLRSRQQTGGFAPDGDGPVVTGYLSAVEHTTRWLDRLDAPMGGEP